MEESEGTNLNKREREGKYQGSKTRIERFKEGDIVTKLSIKLKMNIILYIEYNTRSRVSKY